jgi:hypothetical protein
MTRIALLLVAVAACGKADHAPAPAPAAPPPLAHASPADLASEIADADRLGTWSDIVHRWQGQHVRWTVTRQRLLCRTADDCNVAAFPIQRPARQGWMPQLTFAPGEFAALTALCGDREQCEVTIEGVVSKLDVSPELATSVQLSSVRIVSPSPSNRTQTARN